MDEHSSISELLKKLSAQLEGDELLFERLPRTTSPADDEKLLRFLTADSSLLLKSAFCFEPPYENRVVAHFGSKVLMLVRRIKNSPRAIAITLIVSVSHDSNDAYPRKHLSIVISTFDLLRTIPSIRDFPLLATDIPLADQEICFEGSYKKPLYGKWMQYFVNIFPRRKAWRTKKKIFEQLEVIEEYMRWMIRERLSTFLQD